MVSPTVILLRDRQTATTAEQQTFLTMATPLCVTLEIIIPGRTPQPVEITALCEAADLPSHDFYAPTSVHVHDY